MLREAKTMRHAQDSLIPILLAALLGAASCGQASGENSPSPSEPTANTQAAELQSGESSIARVVFIDQAQACECTQDRINGSWAALQAALGSSSGVAVERIHRDTQEEQAEEFRLLRPMVTVPGIYLLDENGAIIDLLQGEVTEEQIRTAFRGRS